MPVVDGQAVDAAVTNPAFLDAQVDDVAAGKIGFHNADTVSGTNIDNIQREANSLNSFVGSSPNQAKDQKPTYTNNNGLTANQDLLSRADTLSGKFHGGTGHTHTGFPGDAPPISANTIVNVTLHGYITQGNDLVGASGFSSDVSAPLSTKSPSNNQLTLGVVVNTPNNKIVLRHATGSSENDEIIDGSGNQVYGRLTFSSGTWTLSYFIDPAGVEAAYNLPSTDVRWYYQELFNPLNGAPVYSEFATLPSDNVSADIPYASETTAGKILQANAAPPAVASASAKGSGSRAAKDDHTHEGIHSISKSGSAQLLGDVTFTQGAGMIVFQSGNNIDFSSTAFSRSINNISAPQTLGAASFTDYIYNVSGTTTVTLPTAVGNGNEYVIKNVGSGTVTIATTSSQTIDGSSTVTLSVKNTSLTLISDGTNWGVY